MKNVRSYCALILVDILIMIIAFCFISNARDQDEKSDTQFLLFSHIYFNLFYMNFNFIIFVPTVSSHTCSGEIKANIVQQTTPKSPNELNTSTKT